jgi:hypothetical protein
MNPTRRLLQLWIVLSLVWGCVAGPIAILIWKRDAHVRAYERAAAAVWAKYESPAPLVAARLLFVCASQSYCRWGISGGEPYPS